MMKSAALSFFVVSAYIAHAQEPPAKELAASKEHFANSKNSSEAGAAISKVLHAARSNLTPLLEDENTAIALFASWKTAKQYATSVEGSDWFWLIGYFRGRTRVTFPARWEIALMQAYFSGSRNADPSRWAPKSVLDYYLKKTGELEQLDRIVWYKRLPVMDEQAGYLVRKGLTVTKSDKKVVTIKTAQADAVVVPANVLDGASEYAWMKPKFLEALVVGDRIFVANYGHVGTTFPLLCLDVKSGKLLWRADVWAFAVERLGGITGMWDHELTMASNGKSVALLGNGSGAYIEVFDIKTGRAQYRFSTNMWYAQRP